MQLVLFTLDIDRFKPINEVYKHPLGDELLFELALRKSISCIRVYWSGAEGYVTFINPTLHQKQSDGILALLFRYSLLSTVPFMPAADFVFKYLSKTS